MGFSFPKSSRLITKRDYSYVFTQAQAFHCKLFTVLVKPGLSKQPRLGLVVAKKVSNKAVERNRLKRVIRESFRSQFFDNDNHDIVVLAKPQAARATNQQCFSELGYCWRQLRKKAKTKTHKSKTLNKDDNKHKIPSDKDTTRTT